MCFVYQTVYLLIVFHLFFYVSSIKLDLEHEWIIGLTRLSHLSEKALFVIEIQMFSRHVHLSGISLQDFVIVFPTFFTAVNILKFVWDEDYKKQSLKRLDF